MLLSIGIIAASLVAYTSVQVDPVINYCTRYDHQCKDYAILWLLARSNTIKAVVVNNNTLYIDGGQQSFIQIDSEGKHEGDVIEGLSKYVPSACSLD